MTNQNLIVHFCGHTVIHDPLQVYLGVTLDRNPSYKEHLKKVTSKLKTRLSLIYKLVGTT